MASGGNRSITLDRIHPVIMQFFISDYIIINALGMQPGDQMAVGLKMSQPGTFGLAEGYVARAYIKQRTFVRGVAYSRSITVQVIC